MRSNKEGNKKEESGRRILKGEVFSNKMTGTVKVKVTKAVKHPLYKKLIKTSKYYFADTQGKKLNVGDKVMIEECRPLSKKKRWRVIKILNSK